MRVTHLPMGSFFPSRAAKAEPRTIGMSSPGNLNRRCRLNNKPGN